MNLQFLPARTARNAGLALSCLALAGFAATQSFAQSDDAPVAFVCDGGNRFSVEFHNSHVRLRSGSGVFSLARENVDQDGERYSDGEHVFWTNGSNARLRSHGNDNSVDCAPEQHHS